MAALKTTDAPKQRIQKCQHPLESRHFGSHQGRVAGPCYQLCGTWGTSTGCSRDGTHCRRVCVSVVESGHLTRVRCLASGAHERLCHSGRHFTLSDGDVLFGRSDAPVAHVGLDKLEVV